MTEQNRTLAKRWFEEGWNQRNVDTVHEILHAEAVGHMEGFETHGHDDFKKVRASLLDAFPDMNVAVEDMVAEGDNVVVRWRVRASHAGHGLGIPASGQQADFRGMTWLRFKNGKLIEGWDSWNMGELMQKLSQPAG